MDEMIIDSAKASAILNHETTHDIGRTERELLQRLPNRAPEDLTDRQINSLTDDLLPIFKDTNDKSAMAAIRDIFSSTGTLDTADKIDSFLTKNIGEDSIEISGNKFTMLKNAIASMDGRTRCEFVRKLFRQQIHVDEPKHNLLENTLKHLDHMLKTGSKGGILAREMLEEASLYMGRVFKKMNSMNRTEAYERAADLQSLLNSVSRMPANSPSPKDSLRALNFFVPYLADNFENIVELQEKASEESNVEGFGGFKGAVEAALNTMKAAGPAGVKYLKEAEEVLKGRGHKKADYARESINEAQVNEKPYDERTGKLEDKSPVDEAFNNDLPEPEQTRPPQPDSDAYVAWRDDHDNVHLHRNGRIIPPPPDVDPKISTANAFNFGYIGNGPRLLAYTILFDYTGNRELSASLYRELTGAMNGAYEYEDKVADFTVEELDRFIQEKARQTETNEQTITS